MGSSSWKRLILGTLTLVSSPWGIPTMNQAAWESGCLLL